MSKETANGYYTVYTRQSKKVLEELEKTGEYRVKEEYIRMKNDSISEYYLKLYRWFAERCRERIDVPKGCSLPIWLSMHDEYRLRNTEDTVCFTLRIPREKVHVISEYAWGFRVNYMYVPLNLEVESVKAYQRPEAADILCSLTVRIADTVNQEEISQEYMITLVQESDKYYVKDIDTKIY